MPSLKPWLSAAGGVIFCAGLARAEMGLEKVRWQLVKRERAAAAYDIEALDLQGAKAAGRLRAKLTLVNRGPKAVEGILLRYSLCARLSPEAEKGEGTWAVPFMIEERRVPKVGPNETVEIPLDTSPRLEDYLKRVAREGFKPDELKLQVMVEPRRGESKTIQTLESSLPLKK